ncbi:MAG: hypothetical protein AAGD96_14515 [Chloroflexota bacterium]
MSVFNNIKGMFSKEKSPPDFSDIDTKEKAQALVKEGELEEMLVFPAVFGGQPVPHNIIYVPVGVVHMQAELNNTIVRFMREGHLNQMSVKPQYKNKSVVPSKIVMEAYHSDPDKTNTFTPTIDIW